MKLLVKPGNGWSPQNARELAAASSLAYGDHTVSAADTDTHALLIEDVDTGAIVVAFRGSASVENFLTDGDVFRDELMCSFGKHPAEVHRGFLAAFESIAPALHKALHGYERSRPIFITGHSLGGALALLCALELKRQGWNIDSVYTYGQPRVGNRAFAKLYDLSLGEKTWRHVFENDIVARIPHLPTLSDPYRHCGQECFLTVSGPPQFNPSQVTLFWNELQSSWRALVVHHTGVILDAVKDHHIANYTTRLKPLSQ